MSRRDQQHIDQPTFDFVENQPTVTATVVDSPLPTDPGLPREALPRLRGQAGLVLARLRQGPATNVELEECSGSRRINSRVADCRRFLQIHESHTIESEAVDTARGIYRYQIVKCKSY